MSFCESSNGVLFSFYRGDDISYKFEVMNEVSDCVYEPIDITGWLFKVTLKKSLKQTDDAAALKIDIPALSGTDAENGVFYIPISRADTENMKPMKYFMDIQRELNGLVSTVISGRVQMISDVTQRVT